MVTLKSCKYGDYKDKKITILRLQVLQLLWKRSPKYKDKGVRKILSQSKNCLDENQKGWSVNFRWITHMNILFFFYKYGQFSSNMWIKSNNNNSIIYTLHKPISTKMQ